MNPSLPTPSPMVGYYSSVRRRQRSYSRAIADMALAHAENNPQRFCSMSAQIRIEHKAYYDILEMTQKGNLDITGWLEWFLNCLDHAESILATVLKKARFWEMHRGEQFNDRQCSRVQ